MCFFYGMASIYRHPVGKETLSGYIVIRPQDREFFGEDPGTQGREITLVFGEGQKIRARFHQSGGKAPKLKIAFTGKAGASFRSYLRRKFKPRRVRGPRGYLAFTRLAADRFGISPESLKQAVRDVHPMRTFGEPEDIANLVNWLASDEARYASGQLWIIDGGLSAQVQQMRL